MIDNGQPTMTGTQLPGRTVVGARGPVPIIHMTEGNILCRCPEELQGRRFSVIIESCKSNVHTLRLPIL